MMKRALLGIALAAIAGCGNDAPLTSEVYEALSCVRDMQDPKPGPSAAEKRRIQQCRQSRAVQRTRTLLTQGKNIESMKQELLSAAEDGSVPRLKSLIEDGANVNWIPCGKSGGTALDIAAIEQHVEAVDYLLQQNAKGGASTAMLARISGVFGEPLNETQKKIQHLLRSAPRPPEPCETPPATASVRKGDATVSYETQGIGTQPLVFLHDWTCDRNCLRELAEALSGEYQLVLFDFAGYGDSTGTSTSMEQLVDQTHAVIEDLNLSDPLLLGHGLGAAVALRYATQYEQTIAGLVLLGLLRESPPSFEAMHDALKHANPSQRLRAYLRKRNAMTDGRYLADLPLQTILELPETQLKALLQLSEAYDAEADLAALSVPVSCIDLDEGRDYGADQPKEAYELHGCLTQPLRNAGFYLMLESPPKMEYYTHEALRLLGSG